ncbi:hypothetical protein SynROS8604_03222 [Synechococcus sp. ROS8604]|nr:hypothetical protein SynROS8604_03222 [Synechococcus sp. ROS8604]
MNAVTERIEGDFVIINEIQGSKWRHSINPLPSYFWPGST